MLTISRSLLVRELLQRARDIVGAWATLVRGELFAPPPAIVWERSKAALARNRGRR